MIKIKIKIMKKLFFILLFLFSTQLRSSELGFSPEGFWESMEWKRDASGFDFQQDKDVKIAEKNFSEFVERYNAQTVCDYNKVPTTFSIPPIIHFIWLGSSPTSQVEQAISSWKNYHPGWQIELWTDEKVSEFSWSEGRLKEIFDQAETYAEKADVLRLDILYQFGGIYSDIDVICLRSFHDLITQDITFFSSFELNYTSRHYGNPFYVG
ncbi:MAG: hypothetical protein FJZ57_06760, partial [Chlamydiae bacterium]|nr:hypothetical protein [Chlamydiota bacterium]